MPASLESHHEAAPGLPGVAYQPIDRDQLATRAATPLASVPRPFLKWAGSKRALLRQIVDVLPDTFRTYYEPFLGSAALFFALRPRRAVLEDRAPELIDAYLGLKQDADRVRSLLDSWTVDSEKYYELRSSRFGTVVERAARMIYLNKTCWNGLYRVNGNGEFNVPFGDHKGVVPKLYEPENLKECARLLRRRDIRIRRSDFEKTLRRAGAGDLVFLDPPYVTSHNNNGFRDYNRNLFSWDDQERLARVAHALADTGAHVIITNANHHDILDLYPGFQRRELRRASTLAADATKRGPTTEILLWKHAELQAQPSEP